MRFKPIVSLCLMLLLGGSAARRAAAQTGSPEPTGDVVVRVMAIDGLHRRSQTVGGSPQSYYLPRFEFGTGVRLAHGLIATSSAVVAEAHTVLVRPAGQRSVYFASVAAVNEAQGIAILRTAGMAPAPELPITEHGDGAVLIPHFPIDSVALGPDIAAGTLTDARIESEVGPGGTGAPILTPDGSFLGLIRSDNDELRTGAREILLGTSISAFIANTAMDAAPTPPNSIEWLLNPAANISADALVYSPKIAALAAHHLWRQALERLSHSEQGTMDSLTATDRHHAQVALRLAAQALHFAREHQSPATEMRLDELSAALHSVFPELAVTQGPQRSTTSPSQSPIGNEVSGSPPQPRSEGPESSADEVERRAPRFHLRLGPEIGVTISPTGHGDTRILGRFTLSIGFDAALHQGRVFDVFAGVAGRVATPRDYYNFHGSISVELGLRLRSPHGSGGFFELAYSPSIVFGEGDTFAPAGMRFAFGGAFGTSSVFFQLQYTSIWTSVPTTWGGSETSTAHAIFPSLQYAHGF